MLFITPTKGRSENPKFFLQFQETSNKMSQKDPNTIDDKTEPKALLSDNEPNRSVNENFENNSGSKDQPENHKNRDDIKLLCGSNIIYSKRTIEKCEKHIKRKIKLSNILLLVLTLEDLPQLVLQSSLYFKEVNIEKTPYAITCQSTCEWVWNFSKNAPNQFRRE